MTKQTATEEDRTEVSLLIQQAIENKVSVEVLERLFVLQKEFKAERAREEFVKDKAKFQGAVPTIKADKRVMNSNGQSVRYQYASLSNIAETIKKVLVEANLSYSWDVEHQDNHMKVIATLTHSMGHSETSSIEIPISQDQYMTEPQKYASAQTFAKRYTLINVLGITTADEDTDASDVGIERDAKSPKARIVFLLKRLGYKTSTKENVEKAAKELTDLTLEEKNYIKIAERLEEKVKEQESYEDADVQN